MYEYLDGRCFSSLDSGPGTDKIRESVRDPMRGMEDALRAYEEHTDQFLKACQHHALFLLEREWLVKIVKRRVRRQSMSLDKLQKALASIEEGSFGK